jgi:hypothetical protein
LRPLQIEASIAELPLFLRVLCDCLGKRRLKRTRGDLGQQIAGFDDLALVKGEFLQLAADTHFDGHRVARLACCRARFAASSIGPVRATH